MILCESLIDALTFWCAGFRNVTASYGVNGFTEEHREALKNKHVWIAYDRDEAGDTAAEQLKKELESRDRVLFPHGMDANEFALKVTPAAQMLAVLLNRTGGRSQRRRSRRSPASGDEITIEYDDRRYRVRGLAKNLSYELLKINLLAHVKRRRRLPCRHARSLFGAPARGVREAGRGRDGREGRDHQGRGPRAAQAGRAAAGRNQRRPGADEARNYDERRDRARRSRCFRTRSCWTESWKIFINAASWARRPTRW